MIGKLLLSLSERTLEIGGASEILRGVVDHGVYLAAYHGSRLTIEFTFNEILQLVKYTVGGVSWRLNFATRSIIIIRVVLCLLNLWFFFTLLVIAFIIAEFVFRDFLEQWRTIDIITGLTCISRFYKGSVLIFFQKRSYRWAIALLLSNLKMALFTNWLRAFLLGIIFQ